MTAATLWIYIPFITGALLLFFAGQERLSRVISLVLTAFLAYVGLRIPVNSMIVMNRSSLIFTAADRLLGRSVTITRSDQTVVAFFYAVAFLWILGSIFMRTYRYFIPVCLMGTALIIGVIAVSPFIYGVFLVMICALLFMPMLRYGASGNKNAVFRFLMYQTLGMICLAISGQLTGMVELNQQDAYLLRRTVVLIYSGFSLWLAVFPFFSWIASLMEDSSPFLSGFVVSLLEFSSLFILLQFLNDYQWLRTFQPFFRGMRIAGIMMFLVGSVWAIFQKDLQRMMAYIITAENGVSILLLGIRSRDGISTFLSYLTIHSVVWLIWAASVKFISDDNSLSLGDLRGFWRQRPFYCAALLFSLFTVGGMPFLAGFRLRISLISSCFTHSKILGWAAGIASALVLFSALRLLLIFLSPAQETETGAAEIPDERTRYENLFRNFLMVGLLLLLVVIGLFPSVMDVFIRGIRPQYLTIFG